ncbi:hypothetical protein AJ87_34700 [Rhizobium yanglingense]|nr:hypothetical protein AJ87_34700 [Rhizobium yanglingense]
MRQPGRAGKFIKSQEAGGKRPRKTMARQEANEQFQITSFLDGANAAYIEQLYARYEEDPSSVDDQWRTFFKALEDDPNDVKKAAKGASWRKKNWPIQAGGDLVSALDGDWGAVEKVIETKVKAKAEAAGKPTDGADILQATRDSVRAIMMIRAYRMRGHLHAKLDPLGIAAPVEDYKELSPEAYGFSAADYDRKIFIDNVLGLEYATIPQMIEILERTYCSTPASSSCTCPIRKRRPGFRNASKGRTRALRSRRKARRRSLPSSSKRKAMSSSSTSSSRAPSASASMAVNH